jgi:hypothetical protein
VILSDAHPFIAKKYEEQQAKQRPYLAVNTRIYSLRAGGEAFKDESNDISDMTQVCHKY